MLLLARVIWYFTLFKSEINFENDKYVDLWTIGESYSFLSNFDSIVTLFLGIALVQYSLFWIPELSFIYTMLVIAFKEISVFLFVCLIGLLSFIVLFFYMIGPHDYNFSRFDKAFISVFQLFLGNWNSNQEWEEYILMFVVIFSVALFYIWKIVMVNSQILNIQWQIMEARKEVLKKKKPKEAKSEEKLEDIKT